MMSWERKISSPPSRHANDTPSPISSKEPNIKICKNLCDLALHHKNPQLSKLGGGVGDGHLLWRGGRRLVVEERPS